MTLEAYTTAVLEIIPQYATRHPLTYAAVIAVYFQSGSTPEHTAEEIQGFIS